ncbi:MAG: GNAT family N-acetyltransferase, partial [Bacteroidetes bacterium]|nr:GNAT family N-acetyltransferase [Bacteroidota bacterium]
MHPYLKESDKPSEEVVWLLNETILGSNGAKYRHCETNRHIQTIDEPLYLTLQRHQRVLANVTFCRRNNDWYVRYFAFHASSQSSSPKPQKKGVLRLALKEYFELKLQDNSCRRFYAYIDPSNTKSKQMAESFGFEKKGEITTQTFSRVFPKNSPRLSKEPYSLEIQQLVFQHFGKLNYFFEAQLNHGKFYVIRNSEQKIIAFTNVH